MMRVLKLKSKKDVVDKLPEEAQMIVVVYHDKEPMREEPEEVEGEESETEEAPLDDRSEAALEYEPPPMY